MCISISHAITSFTKIVSISGCLDPNQLAHYAGKRSKSYELWDAKLLIMIKKFTKLVHYKRIPNLKKFCQKSTSLVFPHWLDSYNCAHVDLNS